MIKNNSAIFLFTFLLMGALYTTAWAQPEGSVKGEVLTTEGTSLSLWLLYDPNRNVLTGTDIVEDVSYRLTPKNVMSFTFFDHEAQRKRTYYSLAFQDLGRQSPFRFFEVLDEGPISLLALETWEENPEEDQPTDDGRVLLPTPILSNWEYYTVRDEEPIQPLELKERRILTLMEDHEAEIMAFIEQWQLDITYQKDLAKIFHEYNRLVMAN